jgi:hypothetical protein
MSEGAADLAHDRSDWLLLLLDRAALEASGPDELDPVRIQKGMFLLSERGPARGLYNFRAYDWGPFSSAIHADLDALTQQGYLDESRVRGRTWSTYRVTVRGHELAVEKAGRVGSTTVGRLRKAREAAQASASTCGSEATEHSICTRSGRCQRQPATRRCG